MARGKQLPQRTQWQTGSTKHCQRTDTASFVFRLRVLSYWCFPMMMMMVVVVVVTARGIIQPHIELERILFLMMAAAGQEYGLKGNQMLGRVSPTDRTKRN